MSDLSAHYIRVAVPLALAESTLTYRVGADQLDGGRTIDSCVGCRVHVKVRNRSVIGLVMRVLSNPDIDVARIQAVAGFIDETPILNQSLLTFLEDVARYYRQSTGQIAHMSLPRNSLAFAWAYRLCADPGKLSRQSNALFPLQDRLLEMLATSNEPMDAHSLRAVLQTPQTGKEKKRITLKSIRETLEQCCANNIVEKVRICKTRLTGATEAPAPTDSAAPGKESAPAKNIYRAQLEHTPQKRDRQLVQVSPPAYKLNEHQLAAMRAIITGLDSFAVHVMHGVTGSGKTDVCLRAIASALNRPMAATAQVNSLPAQVLVLVPEISLAPQWQKRLSQYLSVDSAITHYKVDNKLRTQVWHAATNGTVRVLIGTRSSVFMPFANLRLIVLDEEHSHMYKEAERDSYHARDVAIWRAKRLGIPVVLLSATPSCATWHNLSKKHFRLISLPNRVDEISLPKVRVVDLRQQKIYSGFSQILLDKMMQYLRASQQVMIYHNSRGYAPAVYCSSCAKVISCRNCALALHLHQGKTGLDTLWCHRCLARMPMSNRCPDCNKDQLSPIGISTQQIEKIVRMKFAEYSCLRLDSDSISKSADMDAALAQINDGSANILIGTQMLVKGHHFPGVGLVVVLQPDTHLFSSDLYARERLLQDLVQVAGRSGREQAGEVIIQTRYPDEELYEYVRHHDYLGGMEAILHERESVAMPPFRHLAIAHFTDPVQEKALSTVKQVAQAVRARAIAGVQIHAPVLSIIPYAHRLYRVQAWIMSADRRALGRCVDSLIEICRSQGLSEWTVDIDPVSAE